MRFLAVFLMALGFIVFLDAVDANAAPVQHDNRSVISPELPMAVIHGAIS